LRGSVPERGTNVKRFDGERHIPTELVDRPVRLDGPQLVGSLQTQAVEEVDAPRVKVD
jgi:hypothetical protein